jgi:hypothetical protein
LLTTVTDPPLPNHIYLWRFLERLLEAQHASEMTSQCTIN